MSYNHLQKEIMEEKILYKDFSERIVIPSCERIEKSVLSLEFIPNDEFCSILNDIVKFFVRNFGENKYNHYDNIFSIFELYLKHIYAYYTGLFKNKYDQAEYLHSEVYNREDMVFFCLGQIKNTYDKYRDYISQSNSLYEKAFDLKKDTEDLKSNKKTIQLNIKFEI